MFPAAPCFVDPLRKQKALVPSAPVEPCMEKLANGVVHLGNAGNLTISSTRFVLVLSMHFYVQIYAFKFQISCISLLRIT